MTGGLSSGCDRAAGRGTIEAMPAKPTVLVGGAAALAFLSGCQPNVTEEPDEPPAQPSRPSGADAAVGADAAPARGNDAGAATDTRADGPAPPPADENAYLKQVVPVLMFDVGGKSIPVGTKIDGTIKVIEDHDGTLTGIETRPAAVEARVGIEGRGNSSSGFPQRPYGF